MSLINQPPLLQTDASLTGWGGGEGGWEGGALLQRKCIRGLDMSGDNMAYRRARTPVFQTFLKDKKLTSVHIQMDNMVALTYLRNEDKE